MNHTVETLLAFILFFPVFAIIAVLYGFYPRRPRNAARLCADVVVLLLAAALSIAAMRWGFGFATGVGGQLWRQIVATLLAYGVFLAVVGVAIPLRALALRRFAGR